MNLLQITALKFWLAALAVVLGVTWALVKPRKGAVLVTTLLAATAAIAAHYHVFWYVATAACAIPWALFCAVNYMDLAWRAKVGFTWFLFLGSAVAIYPSYHDERHGKPDLDLSKEAAQEQHEKAIRGELGAKRWLLDNVPFRLVRGLDLKGGKRFVYSVEVDEAIKDKRQRAYDDLSAALAIRLGLHSGDKPPSFEVLKKLSETVKVDKPRDQPNVVTVDFVDPSQASVVDDAFLERFLRELTVLPSSDRKRFTFRIRGDVESEIRNRAVAQAKDTVERRVDGLGLKETSVIPQGEDIIVEVPGDDDRTFREIEEIIAQTARLEFKMLDDDVDFFAKYVSAAGADLPEGLVFLAENAPAGKDTNGRTKTNPVHFAQLRKKPGEDLRDTLRRLKAWTDSLPIDANHEIGFGRFNEYDKKTERFEDVGWRTYYLHSRAEVTGDMVRDARAEQDQGSKAGLGGWVVSMELTTTGAERFADITERSVKRRFAIILDAKVESAPVINERIGGGRAQISMGSQNPQDQLIDARKLELVLRAGALPAPIAKSYDQRIGPTLGKDAIDRSVKASLAGAILVVVFMWGYYLRAGVIANLAVFFNLVLQVAILAMFGASMTLPGIAGLALTIGIAVDANVLINERIREELRQGKSARAAVEAGYDKAFSAILDGHVTTLISGLILAQYGSGPIKGFAITLIVGIAASLFTGVVCTRLLFDWAARGRKVKKLSVGSFELIPHGKQFDFMRKRWLFIGASLVLLVGSAISFVKPGPKLGTDFKGGTEVEVAFNAPVDAGELRATIESLGFEAPDVVSVSVPSTPNRYLIRVQEAAVLSDAQQQALRDALCLKVDGKDLDAARCPERERATEVKFSPGGDKITVRFEEVPPIAKIKAAIASVPEVALTTGDRAIGVPNPREQKVEIHLKSKGDQLLDGLREKLGADRVPDKALRMEWIGAKATSQLRNAALTSVGIAIFFIMLYIAIRFDVRFAPGGIVALVHDVGIALGAMVLTGREITLSTVAALLTIVGYSITDTVVVYDRIRENLAKHRNMTFSQVINFSISEMLGRTIIVSGVTALSMLAFLEWGTGVIKDFAFTMLVGIVVGTYSSIYIAAPLTEWIDRRFFGATATKRKPVRIAKAAPPKQGAPA